MKENITNDIKNDIDKLDGMMKIKGKCGYEFIGGCKELRDLKQENALLKEQLLKKSETEQSFQSLLNEKEQLYTALRTTQNMYQSMAELCDTKDEALLDKQADIDELGEHCAEYAKIIHNYENVLKEITLILDELKQQYDYMEDYSEIKEIEKKIKEVLA